MKKFLLVAAALCLPAFVCAEQPHSINFNNTVSTDTVRIQIKDAEASVSGFEMYEVANAEFESDRLDAAVQVGFDLTAPVEKYVEFDWTTDALDYYIEFRPINWMTVVFHDEIYTKGSRLYAASKNPAAVNTGLYTTANTAGGNLGSDFGLVFRPVDGLRLAAGADFLSGIGHDHSRPVINFGADYTYGNMVAVGVTARNVFSYNNKRTIAGFVSYWGIQGLTINAGYTFRGGDFEVGDGGSSGLTASSPVTLPVVTADLFGTVQLLNTSLIQLSAAYTYDAFDCAFDFAVVLGNKKDPGNKYYDLYTGVDAGYSFNDNVKADVFAAVALDFNGLNPVISVYPKAAFTFAQNHTVNAGVKFQVSGGTFQFAFPLSYTFRYKI